MIIEDITDHTNFIMFKEFLSDTAMSFKKKIETHSAGNKAVIAEFWYQKTDPTQTLFDLSDDDTWPKFQNKIWEKWCIDATWYNVEQDCASSPA